MKNKQEHAQLLAEALDQVDDSMLQQAMEVDTAEKFHTLDGNMKKVRFAKDRPVATFHRVAAIAACLAVALTITFGGIALAKYLDGFFAGPDPTGPLPATQPPGTTQTTAPTEPTPTTKPSEPVEPNLSGTCGENATWEFDPATGTLTISGSGEMELPLTAPWISYKDLITTLIIEDGITAIGGFGYLSALTFVQIPDSVHTLLEKAFTHCTALIDISLPEGLLRIESSAFYKCSFETITIPSSVTFLGNLSFMHCANLRYVVIPVSVTSMGSQVFDYNDNLTAIFCEVAEANENWSHSWSGNYVPTPVYYGHQWTYQDGIPILNGIGIQGNCGEQITWQFQVDTLIISGTGHMFDYTDTDPAPWYTYQKFIKHIEMSEGILSIGNYAFAGLTVLKTVHFSNDLVSIGDYAFRKCGGLNTVEITPSVTAIGEGAFHTCRRLESVSLPNGLTSLGRYAFYDCTDLCAITLPASLTELSEGTFYNCSALKAISIPANVTVIGENAFARCNTLKEITFLGNLQEIGPYAFHYCTRLESVTLPASLTKIGERAFYNCYMLISIYLPGNPPILGDLPFSNATGQGRVMVYYSQDIKTWTNEALTQLYDQVDGYAFFKAIAFADGKPILPDSNYPHGACGENATWEFNTDTGTLTISGSGEMESVNFPPWDDYLEQITQIIIEDGITAIGGFRGCTNLTVVHIPDSVTTLYQYAFCNCHSLKTIQLPDSISSVGQSVFGSCSSLEQINIPTGLTKIGFSMFSDCRSLRSISLHNAVQEIVDNAFSGCTSLESIVLPNSLTRLGSAAFNGCVNLQSVTFNENITDIPHSIFRDCTSLTEITLSESVTTIDDYAFHNCTKLQTITIGSKVESISVTAFEGCSQLQGFQISQDNPHFTAETIGAIFNKAATEVVLMAPGYTDVYEVPEGVVSIGRYAFHDCTLSGVILPNSVTTICQAAFSECKNLESVILSENLEVIEWDAFRHCQKLQEITFPASLKKVGGFAFDDCVSLRFAKFLGPCPEFGNSVFNDVTGKLYYPPFDAEWFNLSQGIAVDMEWLPYICPDGHTILIHPGKEATCTETGLTEGKSCTVCGEWVLIQVVISANGHNYSYWENVPETPNLYRRTCQNCGDIIEQIEDVSQYPPDSGTCGDSLTWHYADGVLTITGTGPMPTRFSGNAPWYKYWGVITTVVLPEGITYIADYAFRGLLNLKTIVIPSSVERIGIGIFSDCTALTEVHFLGDYPELYGTFTRVPTLIFYYPADNETWTQELIDELIALYGNRIQFIAVDENGQPVNP